MPGVHFFKQTDSPCIWSLSYASHAWKPCAVRNLMCVTVVAISVIIQGLMVTGEPG